MDYGLYSKIKEHDHGTLRELQRSELPCAYFVCYRLKRDISMAAKLLKMAWMQTVSGILRAQKCPAMTFRGCLSREIWRLSDVPIPEMEDEDVFASFEVPIIARKFDSFIEEIDRMEPKEKRYTF